MSHRLVGIDIGGSFTDIVSTNLQTGAVTYAKTHTYPEDLIRSLRDAMDSIGLPSEEVSVLRHGTTVVINSILTLSGSKTALLTTEGFRDVLEIGRTNWPEPYNLFYNRLPPLVPRELRFDVPERVGADGAVVHTLDEEVLLQIVEQLRATEVEAVAVCFLHSYANPEHERRVGAILADQLPGVYVSLSYELSKEFREYERTSTVVTNAYVGRVVDRYIVEFQAHLHTHGFKGSFYMMASDGGAMTAASARRRPVVLVESGPAAGVMATAEISRTLGIDRAVAFDMGGTTAKSCLVEHGEALFTSQYYVPDYEHGFPVRVAALDIVEVGTGGGSIASVDNVGVLSVGPESAGAVPGPACYGTGGNEVTVTDANLVLGRLNPQRFLGGEIVLDVDAALSAVERLAERLDGDSASIALGIVKLANFNMAAAIRRISLERGRDPREFVLFAYGGAGPVHAVDLARELGIPRVIIPTVPGIFSALGMLLAELRQDFTRTYMRDLTGMSAQVLRGAFEEIDADAAEWARELAADLGDTRVLRYADCRYKGQEFTIIVPVEKLEDGDALHGLRRKFEEEYELRYGHAFPELPVETVSLRTVAYVGLQKPDLVKLQGSLRSDGVDSPATRLVYFDGYGYLNTAIVGRAALAADSSLEGPLVIEEYGSATVLGPGDILAVDQLGQLVIDVRLAQNESTRAERAESSVDPITLEVIRNSLKFNLDEVELTLCRTAYSSTVYEVRDMCAGWIDAEGRLIAQGRYGLPIFMADLAISIQAGIDVYGRDGFAPGDVVITNYAAVCGQHLNNVVVYSPIFFKGELVAFTATRAHWSDVGGKAVGSWATDSTEIFQEGVQFNTLKVVKAGRFDPEVLRMIEANVRFPDEVLGDMRAQITACRLGERRFIELAEKFGLATIRSSVDRICDQSEERARAVVADIPDGTYTASAFLDNDGINFDETLNIEVAVTVDGSDMTIDLSGTHEQVRGPMNCGISGAIAAARVAFKCLTSPGLTPDEGAFRPLKLIVPPGTFISAESPAALAQWSTPLPTVIEVILTALAPAIPDRIPAAHMGDLAANFISQQTTPTRQGFVHADPFPGGWGARPDGDGPVPLKSYAHGDTYKTPAELEELKFPFRVVRYELRTDSAGDGRFRGGPGIDREFEFLEDVLVTTSLERSKCPPWGLMGGTSGAPPVATLRLQNGEVERFNKATIKPIPAGSRLTVSTAGGGGYGAPWEREIDSVVSDVRRGYVSRGRAEAVYGVVFQDAELSVNEAATAARRAKLSEAAQT